MSQHQMGLENSLLTMANELNRNIKDDKFRNYILGLIFFKYLSKRLEERAEDILLEYKIKFEKAKEKSIKDIKEELIKDIGYFIEPKNLFKSFVERVRKEEFILDSLKTTFKNIEKSIINGENNNFFGFFDDVDLTSLKLGKTADDRNKIISKIIKNIDDINFEFDEIEMDILMSYWIVCRKK